MPRQPAGEAALKARTRKQLARLARLVSEDDWNDEVPDRQLPSWPGWVDQLAADLALLRPLDPMAALRGMAELNGMVDGLRDDFPDVEAIRDMQCHLEELYPAFKAALGDGDPGGLADRVVILVTEDDLLHESDGIPRSLLRALGRNGRVAVALRLADLRRAGSCATVDLAWRMAEILLAELQLGDALELVTQLGLEEQISPKAVLWRFREARVIGPELLPWIRRVLLECDDLEAVARLVMERHDAMVGQSCGAFNEAARLLEAVAPRAAMLLYRRGTFCVFSTGTGMIDRKPQIDRCARLWARYPDGAYDSHEEFMDRLAQERRAGR